ncbi:hypothetical protein CLF_113591, partial [Clonorchis sinensis]
VGSSGDDGITPKCSAKPESYQITDKHPHGPWNGPTNISPSKHNSNLSKNRTNGIFQADVWRQAALDSQTLRRLEGLVLDASHPITKRDPVKIAVITIKECHKLSCLLIYDSGRYSKLNIDMSYSTAYKTQQRPSQKPTYANTAPI